MPIKKIEDKNEEKKEDEKIEEKEASEKEKPKLEKFDISSLKKDDKKVGDIIENLSKEGMAKAKIGLILRDSYGVPKSKFLGKKIGKILEERKISPKLPEDFSNLINSSDKLKRHLEKNRQDKSAKRGFQLAEAKIKKLSNYYKKKGIIPGNWER